MVLARLRRSDRSRTAFFGLFGVGNFGNEASLAAGIAAVRSQDPTAELWCICADPVAVAAEHEVFTFSIWAGGGILPEVLTRSRFARILGFPFEEVARWITSVRFARRCSRIIVPGTGMLDDFGLNPRQIPLDLLRWSVAARIAGTPFAFIAVGAGPIEHVVSRWLMLRAANLATYRSYRDSVSRAFMASIGGDVSNDPVVPDVVFALDTPAKSTSAPDAVVRIGLGVMDYHGWSDDPVTGDDTFRTYVERVLELTRRLVTEGYHVRLLVGEDRDNAVVELLTEASRNMGVPDRTKLLTAEPITSIEDLLAQIQQTDAVIATRYHNIVAALLMERPTVSIGYAQKNADLMRSVGLESFCQNVEDFSVNRTLDDLQAVMTLQPVLAHRIRNRVDENRRLIAEQFTLALSLRRRRRPS